MQTPLRTTACVALLLAAQCALAAPKEIRRPPVGEALSAEVIRGGSTNITLKAYEGRNNPLAYEIVMPPRYGRLSEFRQADPNRQGFASVVYSHGDDEESYEDGFTFRARASAGGVSSPIAVKIRIINEPPRLDAPSRLDFSAFAGESDVKMVGLTNAGGAVLEGRFAPEEPFHVEGDGRFRLGRGESTNLSVRFSPRSTDTVRQQKITPSPADPAAIITLNAEAKAPFTAAAAPLELRPDGSRDGIVIVTNFCAFPLRLSIVLAPNGVAEIPAELQVPAEGTAPLALRIGPDKKGGAIDFVVQISDDFHKTDLPVAAPAVPPKLELMTPELDFMENAEAELEVRNTGGIAGRFTLEVPPGLRSLEGAASFEVSAGESKKVRLRHEGNGELADNTLVVDFGKDGKLPVHVFAAGEKPVMEEEKTEAIPPAVAPTPVEEMPWKLNEDVKIRASVQGSVLIAWAAAKPGWTNARLTITDAGGTRPYEPPTAPRGWWQTFVEWWQGRAANAKETLDEKRAFFEERLEVPGEETLTESTRPDEGTEWRELQVSEADAQNPDASWRIAARRDGGDIEPVSDPFRLDGNKGLQAIPTAREVVPPAAEVSPRPPQEATKRRSLLLPAAQEIKPIAWTPERDGATIVFEMPFEENVRDYRFEKMQRFFGPDPDTGLPRVTYEGELLQRNSATVLSRNSSTRDGKKYDVVAVRFSGLPAGEEIYWRAVPLAEGEQPQLPSEMLHFWTLPPWRFPWTSAALASCTAALAGLIFLRWRMRRSSR